jgi:hypothetical protein
MATMADPLQVARRAITFARTTYPSYERDDGTQWPIAPLDPKEAQLFAFAALRALDQAGFEIVPKKAKPDAQKP